MHRTACRSGHAVGRRPRLSPDKQRLPETDPLPECQSTLQNSRHLLG